MELCARFNACIVPNSLGGCSRMFYLHKSYGAGSESDRARFEFLSLNERIRGGVGMVTVR